jgi:Fic family protein
MNAGKYAAMSKVSKATATRDLQYLSELKVLIVTGSGRSTVYQINLELNS